MSHSRRRFVATAALSAFGVAAVPTEAQAASLSGSAQQSTVRFASEFGAVGDGVADDTGALQRAVDWSSDELGTLLLDSGFYAVDALRIRAQARIIGAGAGHTFYPAARQKRMAGAVIVPRQNVGSSTALVTIAEGASGAQLENLAVDGYNFSWGGDPADAGSRVSRPGIAVQGGIEVVLRAVRVVRFAATGIAVEQLNNARWSDVFVDRCGTDTAAAMTIGSPADGVSNFLIFDGLTVERSANTALSIAAGDDPIRDWVSNVTFLGLHVESNRDYGQHSFPINTKPLIDIGNVRAVSFIAPQLLGAAAPLLRYRQRIDTKGIEPAPGGDARDQQGGVLILGGQLNVHGGGTVQSAAIEVSGAGRGASITSVKFASMPAVPAVRIAEDYGFDVAMYGNSFRWVKDTVPAVLDDRTAVVRRHWGSTPVDGDLEVRSGDLRVGGRQVRVAARSPKGTTSAVPLDTASTSAGWVDEGTRGPGTDTAGRLYVVNWKPVDGGLVRVVFERPVPEQPIVLLTPRNARACEVPFWVGLDTDDSGTKGFTISAASVLGASQEAAFLDYLVIGRE